MGIININVLTYTGVYVIILACPKACKFIGIEMS
jgi:hypothetical protein